MDAANLTSMSDDEKAVVYNYTQLESPLAAVTAGLLKHGKDASNTTLGELEGALQFHWGGAHSTLRLFEELDIQHGDRVLDAGCGLGGPALLCAKALGCQVTGIDLTPSFISAANDIKTWPLIDRGHPGTVHFEIGNISNMETVETESMDKAYMIHVGQNLQDDVTSGLATEIYRILEPGGCFGIFDPVLGEGDIPLKFPLPFATTRHDHNLRKTSDYVSIFESKGFALLRSTDLSAVPNAIAPQTPRMIEVSTRFVSGDENPPLTLAHVMGQSWDMRRKNFATALLKTGTLALRMMIFRKSTSIGRL
jgi:SAM-dependent methyltransferase